ncbi:hypothetical protein N7494_007637 [Penicillium frequentans]|uniref:Uncharacterized protein n=1 Tax=Penicillium frequentans TaxID=3151616 RepID=A0AAD6CT35_9EURO|nr:hypothetical protein N7494_007637 [Penicillium glabrum]
MLTSPSAGLGVLGQIVQRIIFADEENHDSLFHWGNGEWRPNSGGRIDETTKIAKLPTTTFHDDGLELAIIRTNEENGRTIWPETSSQTTAWSELNLAYWISNGQLDSANVRDSFTWAYLVLLVIFRDTEPKIGCRSTRLDISSDAWNVEDTHGVPKFLDQLVILRIQKAKAFLPQHPASGIEAPGDHLQLIHPDVD